MSRHDRPNKSSQLPGYRHRGFTKIFAISYGPILSVQSVLRFVRVSDDVVWLPFSTCLQRSRGYHLVPVLPGCLHQHVAPAGVPGLGNSSLTPSVSTTVFRRDQTQVRHQLAGTAKTRKVTNLRYQDHCRQCCHAAKTAQLSDGFFVPIRLRELFDVGIQG